MSKKRKFIISGAGVAGLTAAIWLGKAGHKVTVIEKSSKVRADGYIVSLSHKSFHYAKKMGILDELMTRYSGIKQSRYINRHSKEMLKLNYQELFTGIDIVQVMRDELQTILYEQAKQYAKFIFDDSITAIQNDEDSVGINLKSGKRKVANVLIGADGLHSNTRQLSFADESYKKRYFGVFSAAYRLDNVLKLDDQFENHMEKDRYMCVYTTGKGDLACVFIWKNDALKAPEVGQRPAILKQAYQGAPSIVQEVLSHCPKERIYMDPLIQIDMPNWYNKNIVLIGDAAHALTLLSGQGASTAFWGASCLSHALLHHPESNEYAFKRYQAELKPAVLAMQQTTQNAKKWYIPEKTSSYFMRDAMMTYLPNIFFQKYFRRKYSRA